MWLLVALPVPARLRQMFGRARLLLTKREYRCKAVVKEGNLGRNPFFSEIQHTLRPSLKALGVVYPYLS